MKITTKNVTKCLSFINRKGVEATNLHPCAGPQDILETSTRLVPFGFSNKGIFLKININFYNISKFTDTKINDGYSVYDIVTSQLSKVLLPATYKNQMPPEAKEFMKSLGLSAMWQVAKQHKDLENYVLDTVCLLCSKTVSVH